METPGSGESGGAIQFDTAEYTEGPQPFTCTSCARPVAGEYYETGGKFICPRCRDELASTAGDSTNLLRAAGLGLIAAVVGGAIWFGVRHFWKYELGLIAIVVGLMVGVAVRAGAKGKGGPRYQVLAVFLTYTGVALTYAPEILSGLAAGAWDSLAALATLVVVVLAFAYAAPFLAGFDNLLGLIIIGFALFEAWRINRQVPIQGPFRTAAASPSQEGVG